jgi:hypothetical protein
MAGREHRHRLATELIEPIIAAHRNALSANEVSEELTQVGLAPPQASLEEALDRLVRPVFEALRLGRLPLDEWWSPEQLHFLVFTWYARWRLADTAEDLLREELAGRWSLSPEVVQMLVGEALLPAPVIPEMLREPAPDALTEFWAQEDVSDALSEAVAEVPAGLTLHDELFEMALAAARFRVLHAHRRALSATVEDVETVLERTREELEVNLRRFTGYELCRRRELDGDEQMLRASVDALRNVHLVSAVGANAPADGRKTLPQQMSGLARLGLTTSVSISHGQLCWTGTLQPTPVSATYRMKLAYRGGNGAPEVRVVSPEIHAPEDRGLPHVYPGERLCLCYPGEWNAGKMIVRRRSTSAAATVQETGSGCRSPTRRPSPSRSNSCQESRGAHGWRSRSP